jgi:hypothetical protein
MQHGAGRANHGLPLVEDEAARAPAPNTGVRPIGGIDILIALARDTKGGLAAFAARPFGGTAHAA